LTKTTYISCEGSPTKHLLNIPIRGSDVPAGVVVGLDTEGYTLKFGSGLALGSTTYYIRKIPHFAYGADFVRRSVRRTIERLGARMLCQYPPSSLTDPLYDAITDVIISDSFFRFG